ncbi:MAG: type II toxin-antitoxin system RelE/ParE family toxin [Candidatus Omnitrophica bacterium]|nr:type II toxin-antitoxin system RelE/ParE family toxin [Candidatus Omnitrophota bacterium]
MPYSVEFTEAARKAFLRLPAGVKAKIGSSIDSLGSNPRPRGCKKLRGEESMYHVRVGDYRNVYEIRDRVLLVLILRIGHRREVYR